MDCVGIRRCYFAAMLASLLLIAIFATPIALMAWLQKRLRDAVAERHPGAFQAISSMARPLPRGQRALHSRTRYEMLQDPVIDYHIRNLDRMQIPLQYAVLGLFAIVLVSFAISALMR